MKICHLILYLHSVQGVIQLDTYPTNLFIGTGGEGFGIGSTPPGAQYPFGLVRLSPDTARFGNVALNDWHFGGYHYDDDEIRCFSHTHMMGAGVVDYGNIGVMATSTLDSSTITNNGYRSRFSHENETASPGYYNVLLESPHVFAELTVAGVYTGMHRYTFTQQTAHKYLLFDVTHSVQKKAVINASVTIDDNVANFSVSGWSLIKGSLTGRNGVGVKFYYVIKVLEEVVRFGIWKDGVVIDNKRSTFGSECGAFAEISPTSNSVVVVVSLSLISIAQAQYNMDHDWNGEKFDTVVSLARKMWNNTLSQIEIETENEDTARKFYTALYHVMAAPTQFSEAGGAYRGVDDMVHTTPAGMKYFSDLSLWDIHRTQAPLLTLLRPDIASGIVGSLLSMYKQGGALPRWPIANVYGSSMIGNHGYQVILGNILKNPQLSINLTEAYFAMKEEANLTSLPHDTRPCLNNYSTLGYCPKESKTNSASLTLAYAYDDWAVGVLAKLLNYTQDAAYFLNRSENFRNIWDSQRKFMCPRSITGQLHCPVDPLLQEWLIKEAGYTEGNAEQWRWFVPHNIPALIHLFGSNETFVENLDVFFDKAKGKSNALPNEYYWAGNEPDILAVYLFNFAGRLDLTQKHVRWLMENKYTSSSNGLPGNDDYGTLSAWYVWGALGLYPLSATNTYFIGSPGIEKAVLHFPNGNHLIIKAENFAQENVYSTKVEINGRKLDLDTNPFLEHSDIAGGGYLTFWMSDTLPEEQ